MIWQISIDKNGTTIFAVARDVRDVIVLIDHTDTSSDRLNSNQDLVINVLRLVTNFAVQIHRTHPTLLSVFLEGANPAAEVEGQSRGETVSERALFPARSRQIHSVFCPPALRPSSTVQTLGYSFVEPAPREHHGHQ